MSHCTLYTLKRKNSLGGFKLVKIARLTDAEPTDWHTWVDAMVDPTLELESISAIEFFVDERTKQD
ncbi:MAG: hypothetical protein EA420_03190 [Candidatus Competibacteraceae bacterium]|nr:MAG: hypothetical protein EA420_03190 [Candidatus Competibacteraceae bacterium]